MLFISSEEPLMQVFSKTRPLKDVRVRRRMLVLFFRLSILILFLVMQVFLIFLLVIQFLFLSLTQNFLQLLLIHLFLLFFQFRRRNSCISVLLHVLRFAIRVLIVTSNMADSPCNKYIFQCNLFLFWYLLLQILFPLLR